MMQGKYPQSEWVFGRQQTHTAVGGYTEPPTRRVSMRSLRARRYPTRLSSGPDVFRVDQPILHNATETTEGVLVRLSGRVEAILCPRASSGRNLPVRRWTPGSKIAAWRGHAVRRARLVPENTPRWACRRGCSETGAGGGKWKGRGNPRPCRLPTRHATLGANRRTLSKLNGYERLSPEVMASYGSYRVRGASCATQPLPSLTAFRTTKRPELRFRAVLNGRRQAARIGEIPRMEKLLS